MWDRGYSAQESGQLAHSIFTYSTILADQYTSNVPKAAYFSKNHVLEPRKIVRNRGFPLKIVKNER